MIPDTTIIFKQYGVRRNCDEQSVRVRHLLEQHTLSRLKDGRHLLSACEEVGR
jgi:hypothetical protein